MRSVTTQGSLTTTSTFTYDGLLLERTASERSDGTTLSLSYLFDEENDPYAAIYESGEATPVVFTIITTDRGDVRELQDADGASFAFYSYDAFGRPTETTSSATASLDATTAAEIAAANPLRYAGYCYDGFSGLYYLSQRYYDPATAQFITKDPAKADGEESAYQYCGGDPVGKVDPSGEWNAYVHETLTKGWAEGFSKSEKITIASGDLFVDRDSAYHGSWSHPSHWKYHFGSWGAWSVGAGFYNQAVTQWRRGSRSNALFRLGMALHTRQDYYGHRPTVSALNHPTKTINGTPESIDFWSSAKKNLWNGTWRASNTASASRAMMCAFRKAVGR